MANLTRFGKQIHATARELGVNNIAIRRKRKHYLMTGSSRNGIMLRLYFATTPSDFRATRNVAAEIRRQMEGRRELIADGCKACADKGRP
jgi:hypothetical protein